MQYGSGSTTLIGSQAAVIRSYWLNLFIPGPDGLPVLVLGLAAVIVHDRQTGSYVRPDTQQTSSLQLIKLRQNTLIKWVLYCIVSDTLRIRLSLGSNFRSLITRTFQMKFIWFRHEIFKSFYKNLLTEALKWGYPKREPWGLGFGKLHKFVGE